MNITGLSIKAQLKDILGNKFEIINLSVEDSFDYCLYTDLVIFSSEEVRDICLLTVDKEFDFIVLKRVIRHECIDEILKIRENKEFSVVNDTEESCKEVINQLKKTRNRSC